MVEILKILLNREFLSVIYVVNIHCAQMCGSLYQHL